MASAFLGDAALASDAYPDVPEPMIFDMMRPLGAKRGELEVNTLATVPLSGDDDAVHWAPEIEYAFADGFAIEGELPFVNGRLAELKLGLQASFGTTGGGRTGHGVQDEVVSGERDCEESHDRVQQTYDPVPAWERPPEQHPENHCPTEV